MKQRVMLVDDDGGFFGSRRHVFNARCFPLLAFSLALFGLNNLASEASSRVWHSAEILEIPLMSGDVWTITAGDAFLGFSMFLLFIEILRATRTGGETVIHHAFSALVFVVALVLLLTRPGFGNSTFFLYVAMTLLDFMAGFIITAVSARRDISLGA